MDSVVLAAAATPHAPGRDVLDACAGVGVVGLALAFLLREASPPRSVTALEIQEELVRLAGESSRENGLALDAVRGDMRRAPFRDAAFDVIVANPPYRAVGTGRVAPDPGRALARHEMELPARRLLEEVARLLRPGGVALVLHLPERETEMRGHAAAAGLGVTATRRVRARPDREPACAILTLAAAREIAAREVEEQEVVLQDARGCATPAAEALLVRGDATLVCGPLAR